MMDGSMIIHMYQNRKMKQKWVAKTRQKRKLKLKTMVDRKIIILKCQNKKLNGNWLKTMADGKIMIILMCQNKKIKQKLVVRTRQKRGKCITELKKIMKSEMTQKC